MPQLMKKRRSGWAILAAGAMVASILAVGASPAAAAPRQPDHEAKWKACLGPAVAERGFTDVSATDNASHYDNINCLAYYGITTGRTADTYAPGANVTRSQMALFLNRPQTQLASISATPRTRASPTSMRTTPRGSTPSTVSWARASCSATP